MRVFSPNHGREKCRILKSQKVEVKKMDLKNRKGGPKQIPGFQVQKGHESEHSIHCINSKRNLECIEKISTI